jgi:hypothetical protein
MIRAARTWIAAALFALIPAAASLEEPAAILSLQLGQSAADATNPAGLKTAFGDDLAKDMTGLILIEGLMPHYQIALTGDRTLVVWFNDSLPNRPIYRITLLEPFDADDVEQTQQAQSDFGPADVTFDAPADSPLKTFLARFDPTLRPKDKDHVALVVARAQAEHQVPPTSRELLNEPNGWISILGSSFRGRIFAIYGEPGDAVIATELLDGGAAIAMLTRPLQ